MLFGQIVYADKEHSLKLPAFDLPPRMGATDTFLEAGAASLKARQRDDLTVGRERVKSTPAASHQESIVSLMKTAPVSSPRRGNGVMSRITEQHLAEQLLLGEVQERALGPARCDIVAN